MSLSPFAGHVSEEKDLVNIERLLRAFETEHPDASLASQRVSFGTSGHRGSSFDRSFNRDHILAIAQAICLYRKTSAAGPLFIGFDTHALSLPAFQAAMEVFAANEVEVMSPKDLDFTPTPAISHAILTYNKGRSGGLADGVVITPSHNPPQDGGFKYNPAHGGPAEKEITDWIQNKANEILENRCREVKTVSYAVAMKASTTHSFDYVSHYVSDLENILDMKLLKDSGIKMAVDPMGGAGVHYWQPIADHYGLNLTVLNKNVDPQFRFMTRDWDGKIRMDPSSKYAMKSVLEQSSRFDIAFACDTDHDRHGIVTKSQGLMPANDYLATSIFYLFKNRPEWSTKLKIGKTLVSSQMIDRVAKMIGREVYEVPVGFKWFVDGLVKEELGFAGEESAGATFLRKNGHVWTTDKDAFVPALLSAEMTARLGKDPSQIYDGLVAELGSPSYGRIDAPATAEQKKKFGNLSAENLPIKTLGGDAILKVSTKASGNGAAIGGVKVETENGWIAARPSGTEEILKVYAESFISPEHLQALLNDGKKI